MKVILSWVLITFFCLNSACLEAKTRLEQGCAVTCELDGGRLGDNLLAYLHAKWISYKYSIPLRYKPFPYSDQLMLSVIETPLTNSSFQNHITLCNGKVNGADPDPYAFSTLYEVPWFPESIIELKLFSVYKRHYFEVDWDDPGFRSIVLEAIKPIKPLDLPYIPTDRIIVGVHVRTGVGFDDPSTYKVLPTKFLPHSYYIEQIQKMTEIFKDQLLYVYIFTDDPHPERISRQYELAVNNPNLTFLYRKKGNHHTANVLEDLFALTLCDCLIRGESYYSLLASKLKDFMVMITPADYHFEGDKLFINKVNIEFGKKYQENLY